MTDYGHDLEFGYFPVPDATDPQGMKADGWAAPLMNYMPPVEAARSQDVIDRAARAAGRDPSAIRRIYNVPGAFAREAPRPADDTDRAIVGPPEHWAEVLTHLAKDVRERVAAARAGASSESTVAASR
jgi:hypothetical protein